MWRDDDRLTFYRYDNLKQYKIMKLEELNPQGVWKNFYALTQIPRPSGKKEEIGVEDTAA